MKTKQTMTRKCSFDSGHRVMNEAMKCFNVHGHTYICELTFEFESMDSIGYAIDFKEVKRVGCQWIDDILDHGMLLNPEDTKLIETTKELGGKLWLMSLNGEGKYCNPSAENISKEIFLAMELLFSNQGGDNGLKISKIDLWETPNCKVTCTAESIFESERKEFISQNGDDIKTYMNGKGVLNYDDRK